MIALLGGTFDPIHLGHLRAAWEASAVLGCPVRLMPANVPPHRTQPQASAAQRVAMIEAAISDLPADRLVLDDRELGRAGPSYTADTLRELRAELGEAESIVLLLGADAFAGLPTWHEWRALFGLAHLVMLTRGGDRSTVPDALAAELAGRLCDVGRLQGCAHGGVAELPVTPLAISATAIRAAFARGEVPRFLLPDSVIAYAAQHGLYAQAR